MYINSNPTASAAFTNLNAASSATSKSIEKLSSGFRINRAADDAAGLVISQKLKAQVNGTKTAVRNAQDAIGVVQTADGALNEVTSILQRMRDLSMQAGNAGTADTDAIAASQAENDALVSEIDRITGSTKFGSFALLDGAYSKAFNVGATAAGTDLVTVTIESGTAGDGFDSTALGVNALTVGATSVATIDSAITEVTTARGKLGALQNRFDHTINNLNSQLDNLTSAQSRITDTDMAAQMTELSKSQILTQAATAMLAQANQAPQAILTLLR